MEQIIRRRHPNSLPALMMMAATMPDPDQSSGDKHGRTADFLEKRIKKLEGELEKKDEESATLLRGMEQKYNAVKVMSMLERYHNAVRLMSIIKKISEKIRIIMQPNENSSGDAYLFLSSSITSNTVVKVRRMMMSKFLCPAQ